MVNKSIIGATCTCLVVVSFNVKNLALAGLLIAFTSTSSAVGLYALSGGSPGNPHILDHLNTGSITSPTEVGTLGTSDFAMLAANGPETLYTFDRDLGRLFTLNSADASVMNSQSVSFSPPMFQTRGLDVSPGGELFGLAKMKLYSIDPVTGTTTLIAPVTGATGVEALAFAPNGTLYAAGSPDTLSASGSLYTLDPVTGVLSLIADLGVNDVDAMTYGPDGFLYAADSEGGSTSDLYQINPADGTLINLGNTGILELNGIAAIVPNPAAVWLFGSGLIGLIGVAKRKTRV